jgi:hypothetical protein
MKDHTILVLGGPKSGKTHYGAQLAIRLTKKTSAVKFYEQPENLGLFEEPMECLGRGRLATHTPVVVSKDVVLPIELADGSRARVVWPDYGGEQVQEMFRSRITSLDWNERASNAEGWLLMIRPELFRATRDLLHRPLKDFEPKTGTASALPEWIPEAALIEMLQMLLFARRRGRESRIATPRLVIAITCWDESKTVDATTKPHDELQRLTPMLANFVEGLWERSSLTVVGVSALGKTLSATADDEDFVDLGPHRQGFVVLPDGSKTEDLTWPLSKLLG